MGWGIVVPRPSAESGRPVVGEGFVDLGFGVHHEWSVFYRPDAQNFETEQLFLRADRGQWAILTYGTGIDCATDTDLQPAELEDACEALGLRRRTAGATTLVW